MAQTTLPPFDLIQYANNGKAIPVRSNKLKHLRPLFNIFLGPRLIMVTFEIKKNVSLKQVINNLLSDFCILYGFIVIGNYCHK